MFLLRLSAPWVSPYPDLLSMATGRGSPYFPFLKLFFLQHKEKGSLSHLKRKFGRPDLDCG